MLFGNGSAFVSAYVRHRQWNPSEVGRDMEACDGQWRIRRRQQCDVEDQLIQTATRVAETSTAPAARTSIRRGRTECS